MEKYDMFKSSLENQRREDSQFLIHILLYYYIINMSLYKLQTRKEIEISTVIFNLNHT